MSDEDASSDWLYLPSTVNALSGNVLKGGDVNVGGQLIRNLLFADNASMPKIYEGNERTAEAALSLYSQPIKILSR